jgi:RNA polymerase sigma-70 factor (ECF subfamily)
MQSALAFRSHFSIARQRVEGPLAYGSLEAGRLGLPRHPWPLGTEIMPDSQQCETIARIELEIPMLRRYARFLSRNVDQADDLVQECLARAIARIDSWEPGTNLQAWLIVILRNIFLNECRRVKRERVSLEGLRSVETTHIPAQQDASLMLADLEAAFMSLSTDHREVLTLVVIQGMTYERTAQILGVTMGTIKSRLSRARTRLGETMNGDQPQPNEHRKIGGGSL